jgi:hypothetical protein
MIYVSAAIGAAIGIVIGAVINIITMLYAKKNGARLYGLVWLPIGNAYVLGQLADKFDDKKARVKLTLVSLVTSLVQFPLVIYMYYFMFTDYIPAMTGLLDYNELGGDYFTTMFTFSIISTIASLVSIPYIIYYYITFYRIFSAKSPQNAVMWIVLSILFTTIVPVIFMLVYMNKPSFSKNPQYAPTSEPR